jgi:hypothetical protein
VTWEIVSAIIYLLGGIAEFVLLGVLLFRRQYRTFPIFSAYIAFNVLSDVIVGVLQARHAIVAAGWTSFFLLVPQYLLELGVLFEIAWHVLKPVRPSLPRRAIEVFAGLVVLAIFGGVLLAGHVDLGSGGLYEKVKYPLDLTVGLLRMLIFGVTAVFAQVLGIGWKSKVLQIATGLSFYSAVELIASVVQSHSGQLAILDRMRVAAYLVELGLFIWAFTTKEAERREFSPQMQQFLVTISGRARDTRAAIVRSQAK